MEGAEGRTRRGADLLLLHCEALTGPEDARPSPSERVEALVGAELAQLLLKALALASPVGERTLVV